jgi:glycosyltransferase involved in cell wall biosynthesis
LITFSVIIANLNSPKIDRTIQALLKQDFEPARYEVLVVGMDKPHLVKESELVRFDPTETPLLPGQARNRGVRQTSGEIIVFTDADCIPDADWLEKLEASFSDPATTVVGGGVDFQPANYWTTADNLSMFHEYLAFLPPGSRKQLPSLNLAIRRQSYLEVGGFDDQRPRPAGEDSDLTIRLRYAGHTLRFEPQARITHDPSRTNFNDLVRHSYMHGKYSIKVESRYADKEGLPMLARMQITLILGSVFIGAFTAVRIYLNKEIFRRYWKYLPAVWLSKIVWCLGASQHPDW